MRIIYTVYTTDGREWESIVQDLSDDEVETMIELLRDLERLGHLAFQTTDALGRNTKVYFHPEKIVAVRMTEALM